MGHTQATEMADTVTDGQIGIDVALEYHLTANHFPPVSRDFIPVAREAIEKANDGNYGAVLAYPNGLVRSVASTIEGLHLEAFLEEEDA